MRRTVISLIFTACCLSAIAQPGSPAFIWGSEDVRYMQDEKPAACKAPSLSAWRGERVNAQAVIVPASDGTVTVTATDLRSHNGKISSNCIECNVVDYVIADYFERMSEAVSLQPDRLVKADGWKTEAGKTCPVWVTVSVPEDAVPGKYKGFIKMSADGFEKTLPLELNVSGRILPAPSQWTFHLDLWQNPYAVARYFNVPLWSEEHFAKMRPIVEKYASAGGKVITASIIQHPWNCQTYDPFESMVLKTKQLDGGWSYDYSVFDKWVEFMFSCGVSEQIDCYTIVPWGYSFEYLDLASATVKHVSCNPGEQAYEDILLPFLTDFAKHLRSKGWFDRTCIAMDERPTDQMVAARNLVSKADPEFKIAGAVNYSPEVVDIMHDISIGLGHSITFPQEAVEQRNAAGKVTTNYTCCGPDHPNTFTFSPYAEQEYLGLSLAARNYSGYLRWALCSWPEDPCKDSRFGNWLSGDTYLLYPEGSSVRFERLIEGIQDYEKIRILRQEGNPKIVSKLEKLLEPLRTIVLDESINAAEKVSLIKSELNKF
ncbi:MAG: DUF4091 domain-containing protein [Bacteroidales bacterium]|nr:DUF4091 domain-containing protein [Bacteroidales bacterium]